VLLCQALKLQYLALNIGKSCDPFYANNYMSLEEYNLGLDFVQDHFFVIYPDKDFKIDTIFEKTNYLIRKRGIKTLIIDPYNTIEHLMNSGEREDLYISRFMSKLKRFAVEKQVSVNLVAHQLTAKKNERDDGRYFCPELNNIKGGGTFADKADNVLFVWRPNRALDFKDPVVIFGSQKIKKQKLVGIPQNIECIDFNVKQQRYYFNGFTPFAFYDHLRNGTEPNKIEEPKIITATPEQAFDIYESDETQEIPF
jgi:twinkle protein